MIFKVDRLVILILLIITRMIEIRSYTQDASHLDPSSENSPNVISYLDRHPDLQVQSWIQALTRSKSLSSSMRDRYLQQLRQQKIQESKDPDVFEKWREELFQIKDFPIQWEKELCQIFRLDQEENLPQMTHQELKRQIEESISQKLNEQYPSAMLKDIENRAAQAYPLFQIGDYVSLVIGARQISGRINELSEEGARIGPTWIPMHDLDWRFNREKTMQLRNEYIQKYYYQPRETYHQFLRKKLPSEIASQNGYLWIDGQLVPKKVWRESIRGVIFQYTQKTNFSTQNSDSWISFIHLSPFLYGVSIALALLIMISIILFLWIVFKPKKRNKQKSIVN